MFTTVNASNGTFVFFSDCSGGWACPRERELGTRHATETSGTRRATAASIGRSAWNAHRTGIPVGSSCGPPASPPTPPSPSHPPRSVVVSLPCNPPSLDQSYHDLTPKSWSSFLGPLYPFVFPFCLPTVPHPFFGHRNSKPMNVSSYSRKITGRPVRMLLMSIVLFGGVAVCFRYLTQVQIDGVFLDMSSDWGQYVFSRSGTSPICISSHVASRRYTDKLLMVGSNRPKNWFEQLGFEDIFECDCVVRTIIQALPDEGSTQHVFVMTHPRVPNQSFIYQPKTGVMVQQN